MVASAFDELLSNKTFGAIRVVVVCLLKQCKLRLGQRRSTNNGDKHEIKSENDHNECPGQKETLCMHAHMHAVSRVSRPKIPAEQLSTKTLCVRLCDSTRHLTPWLCLVRLSGHGFVW